MNEKKKMNKKSTMIFEYKNIERGKNEKSEKVTSWFNNSSIKIINFYMITTHIKERDYGS